MKDQTVSQERYLFTSESVSMGHPDKVADQISDAILDHCLAADPMSRVACETMVTTDLAVVAGEITTNAELSRSTVDRLVRDVIRDIGYTDPRIGFVADPAWSFASCTPSRRTSPRAWTPVERATRA